MLKLLRDTRLWIALLIAALVVFGGSAQFGLMTDIPERAIAFAALAFWWAAGRLRSYRPSRVEAAMLVLALGLPLLQLLPLPPAIWTHLGGRSLYADAYASIGEPLPWLPISVWPERSFDGLLFLLTPVAAFLIGRTMTREERIAAVAAFVGAALLTVPLGLVQGLSGAGRIYAITNEAGALGFFANRNHYALFCAIAIPATAWLAAQVPGGKWFLPARAIALVAALLFLGLTVLTLSRAGVMFGIGGLVAGLLIYGSTIEVRGGRWAAALLVAGALGFAALLATTTALPERFAEIESNNPRADIAPLLHQAVVTNMPLGSGAGSFPAVFPRQERIEQLNPSYWPHAHNDYAELLIENGLPALAVMLLFGWWWIGLARSAIHARQRGQEAAGLLWLVLAVTAMALLHSIADYPLRTAALAGWFAMLCGMGASAAEPASHRPAQRTAPTAPSLSSS